MPELEQLLCITIQDHGQALAVFIELEDEKIDKMIDPDGLWTEIDHEEREARRKKLCASEVITSKREEQGNEHRWGRQRKRRRAPWE